MRYEELRDSLGTGDIVLFSGRGAISAAIKVGSQSRWSHVGMIVRDDLLDMVLLWESTTLVNVPDVVDDLPVKGVQVVSFSRRVEAYDGDMAVRRLQGVRTPAMIDGFRRAREEFHRKPYEQRLIALALAALPGTVPSDLSSLFCSEVVWATYQHMGLIPSGTNPGEVVPADFSVERMGRRMSVDRHLDRAYALLPDDPIERAVSAIAVA